MSTPNPRRKSPRAPSMSLEEAIDRVQKVYDRERLHPAPTEVVAQHLGYKGANNGAALSALASVRYFGLMDRPREGFLAVTKDFEKLKFAPDEQRRRSILIELLRKPSLYAELIGQYESQFPSDTSLRYELIQRGFSPITAETVLAAFRRSVDYAGYYAGGAVVKPTIPIFDPVDGRHSEEGNAERLADATPGPVADTRGVIDIPHARGIVAEDEQDSIPVRLPGGRRAWLVIPSPFFASDKVRLKAQIDLLLTQDEEEL